MYISSYNMSIYKLIWKDVNEIPLSGRKSYESGYTVFSPVYKEAFFYVYI
jgi:hypothetical protein